MAKSESVREAEQRTKERLELADSFIDDVVNATDNNGELDPYRKTRLTRELIALLELERTGERFRLAEEAEQEARSPKGDAIRKSTYYAMAAWLREKAR